MQAQSWTRLSWWRKTCITASIFCAICGAVLFIYSVFLAGLSQTSAKATLEWVSLSIFPVLVVVLIAMFVRFQRRINLKSGGVRGAIGEPAEEESGVAQ